MCWRKKGGRKGKSVGGGEGVCGEVANFTALRERRLVFEAMAETVRYLIQLIRKSVKTWASSITIPRSYAN